MTRVVLVLSAIALALGCTEGQRAPVLEDDIFSLAAFANPPRELGPQARWWWPGGSVDDATLRAELVQLAELGYSAVEIQPFMSAVTNADLSADALIRTVGEASFLERLVTAACAAQELELAWDLTLGSGWSTGGPEVGDDGARQLLAAELTLIGPMMHQGPLPEAEPPDWIDATNGILPAIDGFDEDTSLVAVLGAEVLDEAVDAPVVLGAVIDLSPNVDGNMLTWDVPAGTHRVFAVYENRTQHYPLGNAYPAPLEQARVIDHLDRRGLDGFLERQFGVWLDAVSDCPPRAVFVDSFELVGELPWTTSFGAQFEASVGYDVTPWLPFLFLEGGESEYVNLFGQPPPRYQSTDERGVRAREDYEAVRGASFSREVIQALSAWLKDRDIVLRLQAHGGYADALDTYALAEVPESEGLYAGGSYDFLRLAASSAEVAGKRFVSSETLVSVGARELTVDEARLVIGRAFSAGINRLMLHGHSYPYLHTDGQRWFPFHPREDSAVTTGPVDLSFDLRPDAAIWDELPALNQMMTRVSYALSRGAAVTEVAWLHPERQVENFPNLGVEPRRFESDISKALRAAGLSYARVSRAALAAAGSEDAELQVGEASFRAILVSDPGAVDPSVLRALQDAVDAGVPVIWFGNFPSRADGLVDAEARDAMVATLVESLRGGVRVADSVARIPLEVLDAGVAPSLAPVGSTGLALSVARRRVAGGDVYFLFNESYEEMTEQVRIAASFAKATLLDPDTGQPLPTVLEGDVLTITLGPVRSAVLSVER